MGQLQDYATLPLPLTPIEKETLQDYEATIERGLTTFYEVGAALVAIKTQKLYRAEYRTFEEYCAERWHIGHSRAYQLIEAAGIKENLSTVVDILPANENQARALSGLDPDQQRQVMQKAIETAPNGKITAQHIKDVRQVEIPIPEPDPQPVAAPPKQISVFLPDEQPPQKKPATLYCLGCGKESAEALCSTCVSERHGWTNNQADDEPDERDPEAGTYNCQFCGDRYQPDLIYLAERGGMIKGAICRACASKALHELAEDSLSDAHFHSNDRDKIMQAGLRLFRAVDEEFKPGERVRELKEYTPTGAKDGNPLMGSWKRVETFPTTAALKRRIQEFEQDKSCIFESRV